MATASRPVQKRHRPSYVKVFLTFARNSLIRDMSFRTNFILQCISSMSWALMNFGLFKIIYQFTDSIGPGTGWGESEFFVFLGTIWIINAMIQTFFMQNAQEFSELIRTGRLDFALLKPIDTQFLISFPRINWSQIPNGLLGLALIIYSLVEMQQDPAKEIYVSIWTFLGFGIFVLCGAMVMYSVMIVLASTSIWLGRNQHLSNFWFYITNFYRYPSEIYQRGTIGWSLWGLFTFVIPILVVSNVPARIVAQPRGESDTDPTFLGTPWEAWEWAQAGYAVLAAVGSLMISRWVFRLALASYRSASS